MYKLLKRALVFGLVVCLMTGCSSKNEGGETAGVSADYTLTSTDRPSNIAEGASVAEQLLASFEENKDKDLMSAAQAMSELEALGFMPDVHEVEEGYLNGFDQEISGFSSGVVLAPMIGTIPFVSYIFTADDAASLMKELNDHIDMRWNICTEADQMLMKAEGNHVFVVMAPWAMD